MGDAIMSLPFLAINEALTEEERMEIYRLRYQVHVVDMGRNDYQNADHEKKTIIDESDDPSKYEVTHLYCRDPESGKIVGAIKAVYYRGVVPSYLQDFRKDWPNCSIVVTSSFVIAASHQNSTIFFDLSRAVVADYFVSPTRAWRMDFAFSWARPHLRQFYERLGFVVTNLATAQEFPGIGIVLPLLMCTRDRDLFLSVQSPYARLLFPDDDDLGLFAMMLGKEPPKREEALKPLNLSPKLVTYRPHTPATPEEIVRWFRSTFLDQRPTPLVSSSLSGADDVLELARNHGMVTPDKIPALQGLSPEDAKQLFSLGHVFFAPPGAVVMRREWTEDDVVFVVLKGKVSVSWRMLPEASRRTRARQATRLALETALMPENFVDEDAVDEVGVIGPGLAAADGNSEHQWRKFSASEGAFLGAERAIKRLPVAYELVPETPVALFSITGRTLRKLMDDSDGHDNSRGRLIRAIMKQPLLCK